MDTFVRDRLPPPDLWPDMDSGDLGLAYPERLNCGVELLDRMCERGFGERPAIHFGELTWTYRDLLDRANRVAEVLVQDLRLEPGNRVLLRGTNAPTFVACWLGVVKAGGVVVATMPLLRSRELEALIERARISHALCDRALADEMAEAASGRPLRLRHFSNDGTADDELDAAMAVKTGAFDAVDTAADDPVLLAFTSGTTGKPKGTVHFHRDVLAMCDAYARHVVGIQPDDVSVGSPPIAFTFGLGALVAFPLRFGASTVLVERFGPETMLETVERHGCTLVYTSPRAYAAMLPHADGYDLSSLRACVSAGEHLPEHVWRAWRDATGIEILDGIGSTEMLHIFLSSLPGDVRPGSTGRPVPGYRAKVTDPEGRMLPPGEQGWLAVQGPTGCRYLDDPERQRSYVRDGWNVTGDIYRVDEDGYFWYVARGDDMIVSSGYNISGPEVESCLDEHPLVVECGVVAAPHPERGTIVKAYVVLSDPARATPETAADLQEFVKARLAPYKYPREVEFRDHLPKTQTGKLQRARLREEARASSGLDGGS